MVLVGKSDEQMKIVERKLEEKKIWDHYIIS
jgi:hypothetical protein